MRTSHHVKTFEEFISEDHHPIASNPIEHKLDTKSPDLPKALKDQKQKRPLNKFLVDNDIQDDENEEEESD
ncbi:MAG: hypothetical protein ABIR47_04510 [Candidatus Kapaibacterium sp.]